MGILDSSYDNLKLMAIEKSTSSNCATDINYLKELFACNINSPRCFSHISDIASLIVVLEKRGILSPVNIEALDLIYAALQLKQDFLDKHNDLIKRNQDCIFTRKYEDEITSNEHTQNLPDVKLNNLGCHVCGTSNETLFINKGILSDRVVNAICSQIGHSWKSFARYLKVIQECTIDKIEEDRRIRTDEIRAQMILEEFQQKEEPSEQRLRLLKALRLAGRKDIHDQVEKLLLKEI